MTIFELLQSPHYPQKVILEKLLCHILSFSKQQLFTENEVNVNSNILAWIDNAYTDYTINKKPLEYILGQVSFLGNTFKVGPATLIPRPETEYMIQAVNEHIQATTNEVMLLDIGTGCGVLGLSTLLHNPGKIIQAYLTDLSEDALTIAKQNYEILVHTHDQQEPKVTFLVASLLDHPLLQTMLQGEQEVILVANLPYIPEKLFEDNTDDTVKKREPKMAFVGGDDGLDLYRIMFDQFIVTGKKEVTMFLEMMTRQVDILRQAYEKNFIFEEVKTFHFNIRILKVTLT